MTEANGTNGSTENAEGKRTHEESTRHQGNGAANGFEPSGRLLLCWYQVLFIDGRKAQEFAARALCYPLSFGKDT